jgi:hypothetical protein
MARSEEERLRRIEYGKAYRADPNSAYNTPEAKAKRAAKQKAYWEKPENKERRNAKLRKRRSTPEEKAKNNEYVKRYYRENAAYREATKARVKTHQARAKAEDPVAFKKKAAERTATYRKRHPERSREDHARYAREARLRSRQFVVNLKSTTPCADCGQVFPDRPEVMDFDHLRDKEFQIAQLVARGALPETLMKEIEKCEIVCANCHRTRTVKRLNEEGVNMEEAV